VAIDGGEGRFVSTTTQTFVDVDVEKTGLHRRFFDVLPFDDRGELLEALELMEIDVATLARCRDIRVNLADGWLYWFLFTKGWLQYRKQGRVERGNAYLDYLVDHYLVQGHNPAMRRDLENIDFAVERVVRRYRDLDVLAESVGAKHVTDLTPIRITVSDPPSPHPYRFFTTDSNTPIVVRAIDGWHRMCSARLCDVGTLECEVIHEELAEKPIRGAIETVDVSDGCLILSGWWLNPEAPIYNYELRLDGKTIASGTPLARSDIKQAQPEIAHAEESGFFIECRLDLDNETEADLVLVALQDIVPVGVLDVPTSGLTGASYELERAHLG
jgi:hypothetical protein